MRQSLAVLIFGLLFANLSQAAVFLKPTFSVYQKQEENSGTKESLSRTVIELPVGWISQSGIDIHGTYSTDKNTAKSETGGVSTELTGSRTSLGAGLGWFSKGDPGFYAMGTYYLSSDYIEDTRTYKGTGYQIDAGVKIGFRRVLIGLQVSHKYFEYKKYTMGGATVDLTEPRKQTYLDPAVSVIIEL